MGRIKKREFNTMEDREKAINLAIAIASAVDHNGNRKVSIRSAAEAHGIPFSTLSTRENEWREDSGAIPYTSAAPESN